VLVHWGQVLEGRVLVHRRPQVVISRPDTVPSLETVADLACKGVSHRMHRPYYYYEESFKKEEQQKTMWKGTDR
jgi:hypothetical protein